MASIGWIFEGFGDKAIDSVGLVSRAFEKALKEHRGKLPGPALGCVGVHRIKRAKTPDRDLATFRRVRVHIVKMREIGAVFKLTKG